MQLPGVGGSVMIRSVILVLVVVPGCAIAQSSQCQWIGSIWSCQQQQNQIPTPDYGSLIRQQEQNQERLQQTINNAIEARRRQNAEQAQLASQHSVDRAQANQEFIQKRVGVLAASGDCKNAEALAMENGMIELANQATTYCAAHPPADKK
jgi:predicted solute-binding protein